MVLDVANRFSKVFIRIPVENYTQIPMVMVRKFKSVPGMNVFVMYIVYGVSGPSLLIESTDSMIHVVIAQVAMDLWQSKQILSSGCALRLSLFTAIIPGAVLYL